VSLLRHQNSDKDLHFIDYCSSGFQVDGRGLLSDDVFFVSPKKFNQDRAAPPTMYQRSVTKRIQLEIPNFDSVLRTLRIYVKREDAEEYTRVTGKTHFRLIDGK
jgi:hypothetical protein